jgi:formate dehydrogenase iron-sulfur subunit
MLACPFNIPRFEWRSGHYARIGKCDFCHDRTSSGLSPACVDACPTGTLKFGKRSEINEEAKARFSSRPDRYMSIYGDNVVGGTSWIYLSNVSMDNLGFRTDLPGYALPSLTWKVLAKVPLVIIGVGLMLAGGLWIRRREAPC